MRRLGTIAAAGLLVALIACQAWYDWPTPGGDLRDSGGAVSSARALQAGLDPYAYYASVPGDPTLYGNTPNIDLPLSLLLFQPLRGLDPRLGYRLWFGVSLAGYAALLVAIWRLYPATANPLRLMWAAAFTPFWLVLYFNQVHVALLALALPALYGFRRERDVAAALAIGLLVAIKPNFAVWPALLFLAGYRRAGVTAFASAAAFSALPAIFFGPGIYAEWFRSVTTAHTQVANVQNISLWATPSLWGAPWLAPVLPVILLAALAMWAYRVRPPAGEIYGPAVAGALLASPIVWGTYALLLLPWFFRSSWRLPTRFAALICVTVAPFGFMCTLALLALIGEPLHQLAEQRRSGLWRLGVIDLDQ